jgi:hypothetical protein
MGESGILVKLLILLMKIVELVAAYGGCLATDPAEA